MDFSIFFFFFVRSYFNGTSTKWVVSCACPTHLNSATQCLTIVFDEGNSPSVGLRSFFISVTIEPFKNKNLSQHEFPVYPPMPKALRAVDSATNNEQLIDFKSSNLSLKRMKTYNTVKIISIIRAIFVSALNETFHATLLNTPWLTQLFTV